MTELHIALSGGYELSSLRPGDEVDLVRCLADGEIARFIPIIPQPYTLELARGWIDHRSQFLRRHGCEIYCAIRSPQSQLVGSVSLDDLVIERAHNAELGYWLERGRRGRGIGGQAVRAFIVSVFERMQQLQRLSASTLASNLTSASLLRKLGFREEGRRAGYTRIGSALHDTLLFGLMRENFRR